MNEWKFKAYSMSEPNFKFSCFVDFVLFRG